MNLKELKVKAKEIAFKNKWKIFLPLLVFFILCFISSILSTISLGFIAAIISFVLFIVMAVIFIGIIKYIMDVVNDKESKVINIVLSKFNITFTIAMTFIISYIATILWTVMLIIPGIIYLLSISMIIYLLAETKDSKTNWSTIIAQSRKMMDGHKKEYFLFNLSFVGWISLSVVTLGIALIWVAPYIITANIKYFEALKKVSKTN